MILRVSVSDFRDNIADYLDRVAQGVTIVIKDEKRNRELAQVVGRKTFDPVAFKKVLREVAGTFTEKNHPEWRTKRDVIKWVERSRQAAERKF